MEFFVDTALECQKLNNFNSFMAIASEIEDFIIKYLALLLQLDYT